MTRNVGTFLWRTLLLQAIYRHYIKTALEIVSVALITFLATKFSEFKSVEPLQDDTLEQGLVEVLWSRRPPTHVVFGPSNTYNDHLMSLVVDSIFKQPDIGKYRPQRDLGPGTEEDPMLPANASTDDDRPGPNWTETPVRYIKEASAETVADACAKLVTEGKAARKFEKSGGAVEPLCVSLTNPTGSTANASLTFSVIVPATDVRSKRRVFPLGESAEKDDDMLRATAYQYVIEKAHVKYQFFMRVKETSLTELQTENPQTETAHIWNQTVNYITKTLPLNREMDVPVPRDEEDNTGLKIGIFPGWIFDSRNDFKPEIIFMVALPFLIPLVRRINAIEHEFSSGLAEHQGVMGLSDVEFFCGHFLTAMIFFTVESSSLLGVWYLARQNDAAWAEDMNPFLLGFTLVLFTVGLSLQVIMVTWIFPKGWMAVITGVMLDQAVPESITRASKSLSLANYFSTARWDKLVASVFPTRALFCVMRILAIAREYEKNAGLSIVTKAVLDIDNVTIVEIWAVMLLSDVTMATLAWYLSKVLPWSTDNPQNPLFFLKVSYWKPKADSAEDIIPGEQDPTRFEELPPNHPVVIVVSGLTKMYGYKPALSGLSMKVYQSKVTVLLGHNGAGKTTLMRILTGMQAPTSGLARVCGYNVATHRSKVRQLVSFCQQTDIFFEDMNCVENLLYFGSLKGGQIMELRQSIAATLEVVDLQDKGYSYPKELSGGMKRRLSIALTIVSQPKLLILDEPTTGMDPETRRHVWDTLQNVAKERTLLISTHDMDEADAIGDQVVIMASGRAICSGSTAFLKKSCGVGYKLTVIKQLDTFNLNDVMATVQKSVPTATLENDKQDDVTIALNTLDHKEFPAMFKTLEKASKKLGIGNMGVSVASMKDVYLTMNMDCTPEGKEEGCPVDEKDIAAVCASVTKRRTLERLFCAVFAKKCISLKRSWGLLLGCVALPLGLLVLTAWQIPMPSLASAEDLADKGMVIPLSLGAHYSGSRILVGESVPKNFSVLLSDVVQSEGCIVEMTVDVRRKLKEMAREDFARYIATYPMAISAENNTLSLLPNPTSPVALPILVNLIHTSALRTITAQPTAYIRASIVYIEPVHKTALFKIIMYHLFNWFYWTLAPSLSYSLAFAAFAYFPVPERLDGSRDVQLMTGLSGVEFVLAHFVFDMIHHALFTAPWCLIHFAFSDYPATTAGYFYLAFLCSGPAVIGLAYLISERALSPSGAISNVMLWMYLGGGVSRVAYVFSLAFLKPETAHYIFTMFPPYAIISILTKIWMAEAQ